MMNRRNFLKYLSFAGAWALTLTADASARMSTVPRWGVLIDAHAHPDLLQCVESCDESCDESSTLEKIIALEMNASSFAAIGEHPLEKILSDLQYVKNLEAGDNVRIIRKPSDISCSFNPRHYRPGVIMTVEGATSFANDLNTINLLYDEYDVRIVTPIHNGDNDLGYNQRTDSSTPGGLTDQGKLFVERLMALGILVDVAHAHANTLMDIVDMAFVNGIPIIDSHTSLAPALKHGETTPSRRLRSWSEMEAVARTGGVVGTWPYGWSLDATRHRSTIEDWASENLKMIRRLGTDHVCLGTDGGGQLPVFVKGYSSILDLPKLEAAMRNAGSKNHEIHAYMGGNMWRMLRRCL